MRHQLIEHAVQFFLGENVVVTVEDHYAEGGLGDAVAGELSVDGIKVHKLAVTEVPRSGKAEELLKYFGLMPEDLVDAAREVLVRKRG